MRLRPATIAPFVVLLALAALAIPTVAEALNGKAAARRLHAYVSCGVDTFRPSHYCYIGDAPRALFYDSSRVSRRYKVCLRGPGNRFRFCQRARQRNGRPSQVTLLRFDEQIGTYTVKWFVPNKRTSVRTWTFYFARGD